MVALPILGGTTYTIDSDPTAHQGSCGTAAPIAALAPCPANLPARLFQLLCPGLPGGFLRARAGYLARLGDFSDARIASHDERAGPKRGGLEVRRVDGQDLPVGGLQPEQLNGA